MKNIDATYLGDAAAYNGASSENLYHHDIDQWSTIVIGAGPSGVKFCHERLKHDATASILLIGNEPVVPYNRVQLSALLAGEVSQEDIANPLPNRECFANFHFAAANVTSIDTTSHSLEDSHGNHYRYRHLVLATGSLPHQPNIPGINMRGVYTFRNMKDAEHLYSRTSRSRHLVVVGGGLLGIEAARALQKSNTKITLVQQGERLMNRQLDGVASSMLREKVTSFGIEVVTSSGVREIIGEDRVAAVRLYNDSIIRCDSVLICAGIKPNVALAARAKLKIATGIVVNDQLQSSDTSIYAIGECCEHRTKTYGLVTPGLEQATAAAAIISGIATQYSGSFGVSRLKVLNESICSMGEVSDLRLHSRHFEWVFSSKKDNVYRKLVVKQGRIKGILSFGDWPEIARAQEAWQNQRRIMPWNILRFISTGFLWGSVDDVKQWPASTVVCQCNNVTQGEIAAAIAGGCNSLSLVRSSTRAASTCGSCKPLLESMLGADAPREKELAWPAMLAGSLGAFLIAVLLIVLPAMQLSDSVQNPALFESVWNDKEWKKISGFTLLGLSIVGLFMSIHKRIKLKFIRQLGQYSYWRVLHLALGLICAVILFFHTGMHFGENLNFLLMCSFVGTVLLGAITGTLLSLGHTLPASVSRRARSLSTWAHTLVVWPLPVLLGMHILTVYYF